MGEVFQCTISQLELGEDVGVEMRAAVGGFLTLLVHVTVGEVEIPPHDM